MKQRVLVLGASGFIGERIIALLTASDWAQPVAASRHVDRSKFDSSVERLTLDATDSTAVSRALVDTPYVVNCIAGAAETIVTSGNTLFAAARQCKQPPRIVNLSSMAVYGTESRTVDETAVLPATLEPYAAAKVTVENLASAYKNVVTLRPGIVYGPKSAWWSGHIAQLLLAGRLGHLGKNGDGLCNLVYVDDVAAAVICALRTENLADNTINLGSSDPITWNEYFQLYAQTLGTQLATISAGRLLIELHLLGPAIKLVELAGKSISTLHPAPPIRPWLIHLCRQKMLMDCAKAQQILRVNWTPRAEGLQYSANWFLNRRLD